MSDHPSYREYVGDQDFMASYLAYQQRWAEQIRESDRVLVEMVAEVAHERREAGAPAPVVLDLGCSSGNLLRHLRAAVPDVRLAGAELSEESLEVARSIPELADVDFHVIDATDVRHQGAFDVIVVNAVLYLFDDEDFESALHGITRALRPGGCLIAFDFFHAWPQDLAIIERSASHPDGLPLHFRPMRDVETLLRRNGCVRVDFRPFEIPIDLERGTRYLDTEDGFEDLNSYTESTYDGRRLLFRGALFQPWCHMRADMAAT